MQRMVRTGSWCRLGSRVLPMLAAGAVIGSALAHEEDWRKLRGLEPGVLDAPVLVGQVRTPGDDGTIAGFDAFGVRLLANLPLNQFGNPANGNDCWGYVSRSGREYALFCHSSGMHVVEVTNPTNPRVIGFVDGSDSLWRDVKVIGDYAYAVNESGDGIQVIDLSRVDEGVVRFVQNRQQQGHRTTHNITANTDSGYLYLSGANIVNGSLIAVSTADPENPTIAGAWQGNYVHDCQVVTYTEGPYAGREIAFCFNGGAGLEIIDVTNKANMVRIGRTSYPQVAYCHQGWVTPDKRYVILNDELDELNGLVQTTTTRVVDVSDLANPRIVGTFTSGLPTVDHNLYLHNGLAFEANYTSGLQVFDVNDPLNVRRVAWFDTYPANDATGFNGAWSTYPYFPSGTVIVSDMQRGLFVLQLDIDLDRIRFEYPDGLPDTVQPRRRTPIVARLTAEGAELDAQSVTLHARLEGGSFEQIPMSDLGGGLFAAELPAAQCEQRIDFYLSAMNVDGDTYTDPFGAPDTAYSALARGEVLSIASFTMEQDAGWVSGAQGDTASTGQWNRMDPQSTAAQPGDDVTSDGVACWVTDGRAGNGVGDFDVDGGTTTLLSPVMNLAQNPEARIGYWRWYSNTAGNAPNADVFVIDISADGGQTWRNVERVGPSGPETSGGWFYHEFRVADIVAPTAQMRMRFVAGDLGDGSIIEAAVDDLAVFSIDCGSDCDADVDGNGTVDGGDFLTFLSLFFNSDPRADFDGSGSIDGGDFLAFLSAFFRGC